MSVRKLGLLSIVTALLLAFGAFGIQSQTVHADILDLQPEDGEVGHDQTLEMSFLKTTAGGNVILSTSAGTLEVLSCEDLEDEGDAPGSGDDVALADCLADEGDQNTDEIEIEKPTGGDVRLVIFELTGDCPDEEETIEVEADDMGEGQDDLTVEVICTPEGPDDGDGDGGLAICGIDSTASSIEAGATISLTGFTGDVDGVFLMQVGDTEDFTVYLTGEMAEDDAAMDVNLDDDGGDSDIVSLRGAKIPATDHLNVIVDEDDESEGEFCVEDEDDDEFIDTFAVTINVTCDKAGQFDLSFALEDGNAMSVQVICGGNPHAVELTANPTRVEVVPAAANTAHSLVRALITDSSGGFVPFASVGNITWTVDKCAIGAVKTVADRATLAAGAGGLPNTGAAPLGSGKFDTDANTLAAPTPGSAMLASGTLLIRPDPADTDNLISESWAVFHADVAGCTPGPATVTIIVDRPGKPDLIATTKIDIIGPPASITMSAAPTSVICGEKAEIKVTVKDALGQNVSDHTRVELITNFGGVIGGTGGTLGFPGTGPVNPLSSGAAETFSGVATAYLVTSENHTGDYEVIATSGGSALGGVVSTAAVTSQVTVKCTLSAAPVSQTPAAGTGTGTGAGTGTGTGTIRPPSTGDAGLAAAQSSSAWLFVIGGAMAFVLAGLATFKFARTR